MSAFDLGAVDFQWVMELVLGPGLVLKQLEQEMGKDAVPISLISADFLSFSAHILPVAPYSPLVPVLSVFHHPLPLLEKVKSMQYYTI